MNDCLLQELKASVNNPDLPILETMQQFTLDAITASGNNSMTDAQKWALNHFFYQIGAIGNTGPYAKLQVIGMPFIGSSLETALNNYKAGGAAYSNIRSSISFADGKITTSNASGRLLCDYAITGKDDKIFSLVAGDDVLLTNAGQNRSYKTALTSVKLNLTPSPKTTYTSALSYNLTQPATVGAYNVNASPNGWLGTATETTEFTPSTIHLDELLGEDLNLCTPGLGSSDASMYGFIYGSSLTNEEAGLVASALRELLFNFITPSV